MLLALDPGSIVRGRTPARERDRGGRVDPYRDFEEADEPLRLWAAQGPQQVEGNAGDTDPNVTEASSKKRAFKRSPRPKVEMDRRHTQWAKVVTIPVPGPAVVWNRTGKDAGGHQKAVSLSEKLLGIRYMLQDLPRSYRG